MKIYIGADHRGHTLKEQLKKYLTAHEIIDVGSKEYNADDDYPKVARAVAEKVTASKEGKGIVICGSGIGVDISANKIKGARVGLGFDTRQIKEARAADDINILALAADYTEPQAAKDIVDTFLTTKYEPQQRRQRRLGEIKALEK